MKYFNTYYFCSVIQYIIEDSSWDYLRTLAEFTDPLSECEREDFPKESYLHCFVDFAVERILFEQNKYMASDIESAIETDGFNKVIHNNHKVFYNSGYKYTTFELAIIHYQGCIEKMEDWIAINVKSDDKFEALEVSSRYTSYLEDNYYNVIESIKNEVVYLLFQNREFLMNFNIFISDVLPGKSERRNIPLWVKRSVKYRDRCKCVMCQKDLSGIMDVEENYENQYDHIVPLEEGGLNDISNMQLMCSKCNQKKGIQIYTNNIYHFYYDN
jgi:hypothetical protein